MLAKKLSYNNKTLRTFFVSIEEFCVSECVKMANHHIREYEEKWAVKEEVIEESGERLDDSDGGQNTFDCNTDAGQSTFESEVNTEQRKHGKKCGRPTNLEIDRDWTDEETFKLIDLWTNYGCLYNNKSSNDYLNKGKRAKALDKIVQAFGEKSPTRTQVQRKLSRLRNYYGGENNKVQKSQKNGGDLESMYVPTWKFFHVLEFLKDSLIARPKRSNLDTSNNDIDQHVHDTVNPPSAKAARKMTKAQNSNADEAMKTATLVLQNISSRYEKSNEKNNNAFDEDRNLVETIYAMLKPIPESMPKAMLRLELQQKVIQFKYAVPNSTVQGNQWEKLL